MSVVKYSVVLGAGALAYRRADGSLVLYMCKALVLATGGAGKMYRVTSNSWESTGDGTALAYDAGAQLRDMEMVQFHPTGMVWPAGVRGILIYMAIYLFMNIGTFAVILCMRRRGRAVEAIEDLAGLSRSQPALALALGIFMFAMAGIPPLAGFFAKFYIFMAAIDAKLYVLAVIGVVTSVVGAYYYVRIVKIMYFDEPAQAFDQPVSRELTAVLVVAAIVILFFFVYPAPIVGAADAASAALFPG